MPLSKTWEAICKKAKIDPVAILPDVSAYLEEHRAAVLAQAKLFIIASVLNDGWKPNWADYNEWKYYPWWDMSGGGFRLYAVGHAYFSISYVGSRLVYKSKAIAEHAAKYFEDLYKDWMVL